MRKHYIVTYEFKGEGFRDFRASFASTFDAVNGDELAEEIIEEAKAHALANPKNSMAPNTNVAIIKLIQLADEESDEEPSGEGSGGEGEGEGGEPGEGEG